MAITFPELTKTRVHIGVGNGQYIEVPMLTVADFSEFNCIQLELAGLKDDTTKTDAEKVRAVMDACQKLVELAKKVMPVELHEKLQLMDYAKLSSLVLVLCKGDDDSEADDPAKKLTLPSQMATAAGQQQ